MSSHVALIRRMFDEANKGKAQALAAFESVIADEFVVRDPVMPLEGKAAAREFLSGLFDAFSDVRFTLEETLSAGDRVHFRVLISGTPRRQTRSKSTRRPFRSRLIAVARVRNGKIVEQWQCSM